MTSAHRAIFVTGVTGFVGKSLAYELCKRGYHVRGSGRASEPLIFEGFKNWKYYKVSSNKIPKLIALQSVDTVVHCAAKTDISSGLDSEKLADFRAVNVEMTISLARLAAAAGVRRFVFVSSIKVHGDFTNGVPFKHTDSPDPKDAYAISKFEAELALRKLADESGMEIVIVRPPLVYGPEVTGNLALMAKLLRILPVLPVAGIQNRRAMISIANICDFLILCINHPKVAGEILLVSDGQEISTTELFELCRDAMNLRRKFLTFPRGLCKLSLRLIGNRSIYTRLFESLEIDISHSCRLLDWSPKNCTYIQLGLTFSSMR